MLDYYLENLKKSWVLVPATLVSSERGFRYRIFHVRVEDRTEIENVENEQVLNNKWGK